MKIQEGRLIFTFPAGDMATKYDCWDFYRKRFNSAFGGAKAVDLIFVDGSTTWLIEVKDYRAHPRTKSIELGEEVALKVRDTLAGLVAAKNSANDFNEKSIARHALKRDRLRIVLHLEQPAKPSKLFPKAVDPSKVKQKIKQKKWLKPVDAHPDVVDQYTLKPSMPWTVKRIKI